MLQKISFLLIFAVLNCSCSSYESFTKTSVFLKNQSVKNLNFFKPDPFKFRKAIKTEHRARKELSELGKIDFYNIQEPLFYLSGYSVEMNGHFQTIWNTKGMISFSVFEDEYTILKEPVLDEEIIDFLEKNDTLQIRKLEKYWDSTHPLDMQFIKLNYNGSKTDPEIEIFNFKEVSWPENYKEGDSR